MQRTCGNCQQVIEADPQADPTCPQCGKRLADTNTSGNGTANQEAEIRPLESSTDECAEEIPACLGRYHLDDLVAEGTFAAVYRGRDDQLSRTIAIKVLHSKFTRSEKVMSAFIKEARILASLEHPGIVPIYDMGNTDAGLYYLITKFINGTDLKTRIKQARLPLREAVNVVAQVAEALHYAHRHGLVHRDVKPGNILLDGDERPLLADFGLALRSEEFGTGPMNVGTPLYMSPEQARREGHRVDARSDVYSLGVVFYELITGRHPFTGKTLDELLEFIRAGEAPLPHTLDPAITPELDRIWAKANAKRASDRYATAQEFADDLRHWLASSSAAVRRGDRATESDAAIQQRGVAAVKPDSPRVTLRGTPRVVPRGLRSFEAEDASFFLELLPGPRNRDGLPDSIQFWKTRLESRNPDQAFRVGVLYGPSGCGKSSLVKAGIIPSLTPDCQAIFFEAAAEITEARLLQGLRRHCPDLPHEQGLLESLVSLRQGKYLPGGKKIIVVIDQFEQWLHAPHTAVSTELIDALRQCDGVRVQCLLLVRDDFWLALSRFMHDLEVPLIEGQNTSLMDLFDPYHARKVLALYGRAFGRLPADEADYTEEQNGFLDEAVSELAEDGKIISVRLSVFADVVKGKPWTASTLKQVGGTRGIGLVFLEETFSAPTAPAAHRVHQRAAAAVLAALLPASGANLKGSVRSRPELLKVSGYERNPTAFAELLRILDQELRLVTVTAPDELGAGPASLDETATVIVSGLATGAVPLTTSYQLTHDYLVPALRRWLTQKQRGSMRGRAMIRLKERADEWHVRREQRLLPVWWEWVDILVWTRQRDWTDTQRKMMLVASRHHAIRTGLAMLLMATLALLGWHRQRQLSQERDEARANQIVAAIRDFHASQLTHFRDQVGAHQRWTVPKLQQLIDDPDTSEDDRLHARLVLVSLDQSQVEPLREELLTANPHVLLDIRTALLPYKDQVTAELWDYFNDSDAPPSRRFRAACALVAFDPDNPRWVSAGPHIINQLLEENTFYLSQWLDALRPIRRVLIPPLFKIFHDKENPVRQIGMADALAGYAADQPELLADLLLNANHQQYARLWPYVQSQRERIVAFLEHEILHPKVGDPEVVDRRRAQALVTLFRLGEIEPMRRVLHHHPESDLRAFLIHLFSLLGARPQALIHRYEIETEVSRRRALLLTLGGFDDDDLPAWERSLLVKQFLTSYRTEPDPGMHSTLGWLLRRWGHAAELEQIDKELASPAAIAGRDWYVNGKLQTFSVIRGPVEFVMGSPESDPERLNDELQHRVRIPRSFAVSTHEVTLEQFLRAQPDYPLIRRLNPEPKAAVCGIDWFDAVRYCRWLSEQEGIPEEQMCYPPLDQIKEGMELPKGYLSRTGYRLPTEAEWECACRASSQNIRFYGSVFSLMSDYAWHSLNSHGRNHPVGLLKPNELGLFDIHGNVWEWCQDAYQAYPVAKDGGIVEDIELPDRKEHDIRVLRGGGFSSNDLQLRSAARRAEKSSDRNHHYSGLRLARTLPKQGK